MISFAAVMIGSFLAFAVSAPFAAGSMPPRIMAYRFAAADTASEAYRPKVVS